MNNALTTWLFGLTLAGTGLWTAFNLSQESLALNSLGDGQSQSAIAKAWDEKSPVRLPSLNFWSLAEYKLFKQGSKGVLVGKEGWLYSDEEFDARRAEPMAMAAGLTQIIKTANDLRDAGARLCIVFVPDKARAVPVPLRHHRSALIDGRYDLALNTLAAAGFKSKDLRHTLATLPERKRFLKTDTHWTPQAAQAVANSACPEFIDQTKGDSYETTNHGPQPFMGDLSKFVALGSLQGLTNLRPDPLIERQTEATAALSANALFGDVAAPIVLIGTSYSAIETWNFRGAWCESTNRDVVNWAKPGQGPFVPMDLFLKSQVYKDNPKVDIIWEIPERQIVMLEQN